VPAEPLKNILHKLQADLLEFYVQNGKLYIKGKGERIWIPISEKIELPIENLEVPTKWKSLPKTFSEGLKLVCGCARKDESRFELTCIHIHPEWIEAYDTNQ